ncbi:MAG: DUF4838 domain-containing protein, partial [Bacteroidetes bacterium]
EFFFFFFEERRAGIKGFVGKGDYFSVVPLDNRDYGKQCKPPLQPERRGKHFGAGVASNYIFNWVNNVAKEVRKKYPDKYIASIAYADMFEPPDFDMEPNVAICVCMADGWDGYGMNILKAWTKKVSRVFLWEYHYPVGHFPLVYPHKVAKYIQEIHKLGVKGMFMEMGDMNSALYHINYYIISKALVENNFNVDKALSEYYRRFYGPAEKPMKKFWSIIENARTVEKTRYNSATGSCLYKDWEILGSKERMKKLETALRRAESLVKTEPFISRIRIIRTGVMAYLKKQKAKHEKIVSMPTKILHVKKITGKIILDGKLDDSCWQTAETSSPFVTLQNSRAERKTTVKAIYDNKNLYFGFYCEEPYMKSLHLTQRTSVPGLCTDDSVEFTLDIGRKIKDYIHVMMNANGLIWYRWCGKYAQNKLPDLHIQGKTYKGKNFWSAEFIVPFEKITDGVPPESGAVWGANFMRNCYTPLKWKYNERSGARWTAWSPTFATGYHIIDRFGKLIFE